MGVGVVGGHRAGRIRTIGGGAAVSKDSAGVIGAYGYDVPNAVDDHSHSGS